MYRVIIVDDEPVIRRGLRETIEWDALGLEVAGEAADGAEALKLIREIRPEILITDIRMPEMDGIEAMKRIRDYLKENGKVVKMIALTANAVSGAREMFMNEGFDGFISKPIDTTDFERVMKKLLYGERPSEDGGVFV